MFQSARVKLTAWYLLFILTISIAFSVAMYRVLTNELDRVERMQRERQQRILIIQPDFFERIQRPPMIDTELIEETKNRLKLILILINLSILGLVGVAGYFLAGRTLKPIKQMVDEQNRFITDASHELRTPLTSLRAEIEVNLRDKQLNLSQAKKLLVSNLEEVNTLQTLSDNLIRLTQYQKSNGHILMEPVVIKTVLDEAIKKVTNLAKHKDITLINQTKDYSVLGDHQGLVEVFVIFLDNAIKYSSEKSEVTVATKKTDHTVVTKIKDQGIGISEKDLPHIFDRFYRVDKSRTKTEVSGYGLGLSIAKQIIAKHHGSIKVESALGKGTTFSIYLPTNKLS